MTVLIGYVPTPVGEAALEAGLAEAAVRERGRGDPEQPAPRQHRGRRPRRTTRPAAELVERARAAGVTATVDHADHGADIVDTFEAVVERTDGVGSSSSGCAAAPRSASS